MDQQLVSHFAQKFRAFDREELVDLVARRADLSEEAAAGLDEALRILGLSEEDVYTPSTVGVSRSEEEVEKQLVSEIQRSRELWRGGVATASKILMGLTFMIPVQAMLKHTQLGALWVGLSLLIAGYVGYWVGREVTKGICAESDLDVAAKKTRLWVLLGALIVAYIIVYAISSAVFGRAR